MKKTTKEKIIRIIIIIIGVAVIYGGIFLIMNWASNDNCYCQYNQYLPTDYCWGVCEF